MKITQTIEVEPLKVPNFILIKNGGGGGGTADEKASIHIKDVSRQDLIALCNQFRDDLLKKAGHKPEANPRTGPTPKRKVSPQSQEVKSAGEPDKTEWKRCPVCGVVYDAIAGGCQNKNCAEYK